MRLLGIRLVNWRSFPACDIDLDQQLTVIIGQNGTGKTALLNAFVWGLHGQTTRGFSRPDDLCNHQAKLALDEDETTLAEVVVTFSHSHGAAEYRYEAHRSLAVTRTGPGTEDFEVSAPRFVLNRYPLGVEGDARTYKDQVAEREVRSIIPAGLNPYFFFPAENIGASISAPDSSASSIKDAIDVLLGLKRYEIAQRTIQRALDLPQLKEKKSNNIALRKAQMARDGVRKRHANVVRELSELPEEIRRVNALRDEAESALRRIEEAQDLLKEWHEIDNQYQSARRAADEAEDRQRKILDDECFNLFGAGALKKAREVLDNAKAQGRIPPKVSAGLLDDLIENADTCICGQVISEVERQILREHRAKVLDDQLAEIAGGVHARVIVRDDRLFARADTETPYASVRAAENAIHDAHRDMTTWLDRRDEFITTNPDLPKMEDSNPAAMWKRYAGLSIELERKLQDLEVDEEKLSQERRAAEKKYEQLRRAQGKADAVSNARSHLTHIEDVIEDLRRLLRGRSRLDIERAMNKTAREVLLRDYTISLTTEFDLDVRQDGLSIGESSAERAWVTFAFVGAIARLIDVYDKHLAHMDEAGDIDLEPGSGYPLVLDAPFSPFDKKYAANFGERLPDLAAQSVLIIREDHLDHLTSVMDPSASVRAYLMCFHGPTHVTEHAITWGDGTRWGDASERVYIKPASGPSRIRTELLDLPI